MTSTNGFLYCQMNVFCIVILLIILIKSYYSIDRRKSFLIFRKLICCMIVYLFCDLLWGLIDSEYIFMPIAVNRIINIGYFSSLALIGFGAFHYAEHAQESSFLQDTRYSLVKLPLGILLFCIIASYWTGWIFYIDSANNYHRGPLYPLQLIISYGYLFYSICNIFVKFMQKQYFAKHREYKAILTFFTPPTIAGVLQMLLGGYPILCMGITLGALLASMESNELLISLDPLTQMNNRNRMIQYLSSKMNSHTPCSYLYLLMMDVDYFKKINDQFGHNEGDRALVEISNVLKSVCGQYDCFGARYGGDEFVVIFDTNVEENIHRICDQIRTQLQKQVQAHELKYNLKVSIGYALFKETITNIPDFIALADEELYKVKKARKSE